MTGLDILNVCIAKAEAETKKTFQKRLHFHWSLLKNQKIKIKHVCFSRPVSTNLNWFLVKKLTRKMASCGMTMDPHSAFTVWYMFFQEWQELSKTDISSLNDMISLIQSACCAGPPENKVLFTRQQATTLDTSTSCCIWHSLIQYSRI